MYSSIYTLQSSTRRLPIQALFGFMLKQSSPIRPPSLQSLMCGGLSLVRLESPQAYLKKHYKNSFEAVMADIDRWYVEIDNLYLF